MVDKKVLEEIIADLDRDMVLRTEINFANSDDFSSAPEPESVRSAKRAMVIVNPKPIGKEAGKEKPEDKNTKMETEPTANARLLHHILWILQIVSAIFGCKFKYGWTPNNPRSMFGNFIMVTFWMCLMHNQYNQLNDRDFIKLLEPFSLYGQTVSCTMKWLGYLIHRSNLNSLCFSMQRLCRQNHDKMRSAIIEDGLKFALRAIKLFYFSVIFAVLAYLTIPVKAYIVDRTLLPFIPVKIPFCDSSTMKGYIVESFIQAVFGTYSSFVTIVFGALFILMICFYTIQIDLFQEDFKDLDKMWSSKDAVPLSCKHAFLLNIWKKRMDTNSFLKRVKYVYQLKLTIYFFFNYFSQIVCLFEVTKLHWVAGFFIAIGLFSEMLSYSIMGTQITIANDKYCEAIYKTKWYMYDVKSQEVILFLLHESQQPKEIMLSCIGPLNIVTGITIVKSIYYYYTVLIELF